MEAPAKLNLHLRVGKKREDGFHDIESLFVMIDLADQINISSLKTGNQCEIIGDFDCRTEDNLIYRAWKLFRDHTGINAAVTVKVLKRIPAQAGLGGGSSDAAAMLKGMNLLFDGGLTLSELSEMGAMLGSDVPFFLSDAPASIVRGRGERIRPLKAGLQFDGLLVNPGPKVSTPAAFGWLDERDDRNTEELGDRRIEAAAAEGLEAFSVFENDFAAVVSDIHPVYGRLFADFKRSGAAYSNLTGSGSVAFGLYFDEKNAVKACETLKNEYNFVRKIKSLDRIPYAILE